MRTHRRCFLTAVGALTLAACGGGGGTEVASAPTPPAPPPPPPPVTIIPGLTASQQFVSAGGSVSTPTSAPGTLETRDDLQLQIRYDASSQQYQVLVPNVTTWETLTRAPGGPDGSYTTGGNHPYVSFREYAATGYDYSALAVWTDWTNGQRAGGVAIGIPTPAGSVPTAGNASYSGTLAGYSTETINDAWGPYSASIEGSIDLAFDFGAGTLSGSIRPVHYVYERISLGTLDFANTVYSAGSSTFAGSFTTSLAGPNSFSGRFTGPGAQELIGSFAFPYVSPLDGNIYDAGGGFVGKRP